MSCEPLVAALSKSFGNFQQRFTIVNLTGIQQAIFADDPRRVYLALWSPGVGQFKVGPAFIEESALPFIILNNVSAMEWNISEHGIVIQRAWLGVATVNDQIFIYEELFTG